MYSGNLVASKSIFTEYEFSFASHKDKISKLKKEISYSELNKIKQKLNSANKDYKRETGARYFNFAKVHLNFSPLLSIHEFEIANACLQDVDLIKSLNFTALACMRVYAFCVENKFDIALVADEFKQEEELKTTALELIAKARLMLDEEELCLLKEADVNSTDYENKKCVLHLLRAANYYVEAELNVTADEMDEAFACYENLKILLLKAEAEQFGNYYPRVCAHYASLLRKENKNEKAFQIFTELEKHFANDNNKNNVDAGYFHECYGDLLLELKHFYPALENFKKAEKVYANTEANSKFESTAIGFKSENLTTKIKETQKEINHSKHAPTNITPKNANATKPKSFMQSLKIFGATLKSTKKHSDQTPLINTNNQPSPKSKYGSL